MNIEIEDTIISVKGNNKFEDAYLDLYTKDLLGKTFKLTMGMEGSLDFSLIE